MVQPVAITAVSIEAVTFLSDHNVLTNYTADWDEGGQRFPKPEWPFQSQDPPPVTHTMGERVRIRVRIKVEPANATPAEATLTGLTPGGLRFSRAGQVQGGTFNLDLTSDQPLPQRVRRLNFPITWTVTGIDGVAIQPGTTPHRIFVTIGVPSAVDRSPEITFKRMDQAVKEVAATNSVDPHEIAGAIMGRWRYYDPYKAHVNAWELKGDQAGADCQTMVRYVQYVLMMVGCPGNPEWVVVWAKAGSPTVAQVNPGPKPHVSDPIQWYKDVVGLEKGKEKWYATLVDGSNVPNRYEACLRIDHGGVEKFYAGGAGVHNDAQSVLRVFKGLAWFGPSAESVWEDEFKAFIRQYR